MQPAGCSLHAPIQNLSVIELIELLNDHFNTSQYIITEYIVNKLGQSCAKLCSSFESFASIILYSDGRVGGWVAGWVGGSTVII